MIKIRKQFKIFSLIGLIFGLGFINVRAAEVGASILRLNPSAREAAMGNAGAATVNGAPATFMNPAGLGSSKNGQVFLTHSQGIFNTSLNAVSFSHPLKSLDGRETKYPYVIGISAVHLNHGKLTSRDETGQNTGSFDATDTVFGLSVGWSMKTHMSLGFTLKQIQQKIGSESAEGFAFDVGTQMGTPIQGLKVAASINNVGQKMKFLNGEFSLPTSANIGFGYLIKKVKFVADAKFYNGGQTDISFGTEFLPVGNVALRLGYVNTLGVGSLPLLNGGAFSQLSRFAAGIGLRLGSYRFDYALLPNRTLDETHRISFGAHF